jgi:leader peptidase (prepilin peptidase)/N-methyltransferase
VELLTAVLFALFGMLTLGSGQPEEIARMLWSFFLIALLIAIAVYDARNMEIPLILLLVGIAGAVAYALIGTFLSGDGFLSSEAFWKDMFWGAGIAALLFYGLVYVSKETWMGMGDVWLAGIAGAAVGLPALLLLLTLSFFIGSLVGGVLLLLGRKGMKSQVPFAPFLVAGTFMTLLLGFLGPWWLSLLLLPAV